MNRKISILGFAGSLRKASYNKAILKAALDMVPENAGLEIFDLDGIPPFNQDMEGQPPEKVKNFKLRIMGASIGMLGTARAQYHLRQSFVFLNMYPLNQPEVMIPFAHEKIDQNGGITDQKTLEKIRELLAGLVAWTRKLKGETAL
jgi:chromate reductase